MRYIMDYMDRKRLALIHIIKKELNLSDDQYRQILSEAAGVNSAKELDEEKFRRLLHYFVRSRHWQVNRYGLTLRQKLYIEHMARELEWTPVHLDNFIHKYFHRQGVATLTRRQAIKAIEALKNVKQHSLQGRS
jgi:hypothetical protein